MPDTRHHGLSPTQPEFLHLFLHSISAKTIYKYDADSFRHSEHLRIAPRSGYATARCADDRAQGKPGPMAGAHDAGIDYGVLAADIAAENSHVLTCSLAGSLPCSRPPTDKRSQRCVKFCV
jgi:hypothetical protein